MYLLRELPVPTFHTSNLRMQRLCGSVAHSLVRIYFYFENIRNIIAYYSIRVVSGCDNNIYVSLCVACISVSWKLRNLLFIVTPLSGIPINYFSLRISKRMEYKVEEFKRITERV